MLKIIAGIAVVIIATVLIIAATKPDSFTVQRTLDINAAPEKIYPFINDFHQWTQWSPYENRDPNMQRTYSGAEAGKGAIYAWRGNKDIGEGRMEITETREPNSIVIALDFIAPFKAHNIAEFTIAPRDNVSTVTWTMRGPSPFVTKIMQVFFSMDKMVGTDFETGLANLKQISEK